MSRGDDAHLPSNGSSACLPLTFHIIFFFNDKDWHVRILNVLMKLGEKYVLRPNIWEHTSLLTYYNIVMMSLSINKCYSYHDSRKMLSCATKTLWMLFNFTHSKSARICRAWYLVSKFNWLIFQARKNVIVTSLINIMREFTSIDLVWNQATDRHTHIYIYIK